MNALTKNVFHRRSVADISLCLCLTKLASAQGLEDEFEAVEPIEAPYAAMQVIDGRAISAEELTGKVVLINFWATWCPPCVEELPTMQNAWEKFGRDDFEIIAVAVAETPSTVTEFQQKLPMKLDFPIITDENLEIFHRWEVRGLPTSFLVDRNGIIQRKAVGGRDFNSSRITCIIQHLV